jgi:hypothetical protein
VRSHDKNFERRRNNKNKKLKREAYEKELGKLQVRLCHLQEYVTEKVPSVGATQIGPTQTDIHNRRLFAP